jgi:hypothetical protein
VRGAKDRLAHLAGRDRGGLGWGEPGGAEGRDRVRYPFNFRSLRAGRLGRDWGAKGAAEASVAKGVAAIGGGRVAGRGPRGPGDRGGKGGAARGGAASTTGVEGGLARGSRDQGKLT